MGLGNKIMGREGKRQGKAAGKRELRQKNIKKVEVYLSKMVRFTDRQKEAFAALATHRYILYGGARGGGKSYLLRWAALMFLIWQWKVNGLRGVRVMLAAETYPELKERQLDKIDKEFPEWMGEMKNTQAGGLGYYIKDKYGGGVIALRNLDKPEKYKSAEFAGIFVDELTMNTKETYDILRGSLRWPGVNHTVFVGATNPGGIGHMWVKAMWVDSDFQLWPELMGMAKQYKFIQSLPADNPYLEQSYWDELNSLPKEMAEAWVRGNWDIFQGMALPGFDRNRHVLTEPIDLPLHWPRWTATDWGFTNPFCTLWFCKDPDTKRVFVYREIYATQMTDDQQAGAIITNTPPTEKINIHYADPAMWAKKNMQGIVMTTYDEYLAAGVALTKADNDRLGGKRKIQGMMANLRDGMPGLLIFPQCSNLIRTLPALALDKVNVEDVDTDQEDHPYDTLRYGVTNERAHNSPGTKQEEEVHPLELASDIF